MSVARLEKIVLNVLKTWQGSEEELGADLEVATAPPFGLTPETLRSDAERRRESIARIRACEGGDELLKFENTQRRNNYR